MGRAFIVDGPRNDNVKEESAIYIDYDPQFFILSHTV